MKKVIICIWLFWCSFANAANTMEASQDLSLSDALLLALRYNPSVKNAEIQRVIDKFNLRLAENALEVQYALSGQANYTNIHAGGISSNISNATLMSKASITTSIGTNLSVSMNNQFSQSTGAGSAFNPGVTFALSQPVMQGAGSIVSPASAGLFSARIQEEVNKLALKNTIIQTVTQVIQQYAAVVQAQNTVDSQKLSLKQAQATVDQYQALIKAGRNAPTDIVQPQAVVASQEVNLQQSLNNLQQAKQSLLYLLGLDATVPISVNKHIAFINEEIPTLTNSIHIALKNNITYQQQILNLEVLKRQVLISEDTNRPKLDLSLSSTYGNATNVSGSSSLGTLFNGQNNTQTVGLTLDVPIDNYNVKTNIVRAKIGLQQAKINLDAMKRQIETQVTATYNSLLSQKLQITQAEQAVKLANQSLEIAKVKQKYGKITPFEVTSLQNALLAADIAEIESNIAYLTSLANFDQLLGISLDRWHISIRY